MKLEGKTRVSIAPVHAAFPYPVIPSFAFTDHPYEYGPSNTDGSSIETNLDLEVVYPRPVFVPHNNKSLSRTPPSAGQNAHLPDWNWTETIAPGGSLAYMGDIWLTPWVKSTWTDEPALALYYGHVTSPAGSANTRNNFVPSTNTVELMCGVGTSGGVTDMQGFYLQLGAELDARTETWTSSGGVWSHAYSFPSSGAALPYVLLTIGLGNQGSSVPTQWIQIVRYMQGHVVIYNSPAPWILGTKIREIIPDSNPGDVVGGRSYGYHGYYGWYGYGDSTGKMICAKYMNGVLTISGFATGDPIKLNVLALDGNKIPVNTIKNVGIGGFGFRGLMIGFSPMKFLSTASYTSPLISTGTNPNDFTTTIHYGFNETQDSSGRTNNLTGATASTTNTVNGTQVQYSLTFNGTPTGTYNAVPYVNLVQSVKGVTIFVPEHVLNPYGNVDYLYPEEVVVTQEFDINRLTITSKASMIFNDFKPMNYLYPDALQLFWGQFAQFSGLVAIQIEMEVDYYHPSDTSPYDSTGWVTVFTGYGNTTSQHITGTGGNQNKFVMNCSDRSLPLRNPKYAVPWMDGWNLWYHAAYVANLGGIKKGHNLSDSDMVFISNVPADPYEDSPSGDAYFLPVGTGGHPLIRFQGGESPWSIFDRTLTTYGYLRYFNAYGKFNVERFELSNTANAYRVFGLVDDLSQEGGINPNINSAMFSGTVDRDLTDVRNSVILLGISAYSDNWDYITYQVQDLNSIYGGNDPNPFALNGGNYLGFKQEFVWKDSQFATPDFIQKAAFGVFNIASFPSTTTVFSTWLQPDIFPAMKIGVYNIRAGLYDVSSGLLLELMVTRVSHRIKKGEIPTTTMGCRWVPPGLGAPV